MKDFGFRGTFVFLKLAVVFICTRYLCAAIMVAGALGDVGTYRMALGSLGPFLPVMSIVCLCGAVLFAVAELIVRLRNQKK